MFFFIPKNQTLNLLTVVLLTITTSVRAQTVSPQVVNRLTSIDNAQQVINGLSEFRSSQQFFHQGNELLDLQLEAIDKQEIFPSDRLLKIKEQSSQKQPEIPLDLPKK